MNHLKNSTVMARSDYAANLLQPATGGCVSARGIENFLSLQLLQSTATVAATSANEP